MRLHVDLDLLGVFGCRHFLTRLATVRARALVRRQFDDLFDDGQMRLLASLGTFLRLRGIGFRLVFFKAFEMIGTIFRRLLLGLLPEELRLQPAVFAAKMLIFLFQNSDPLERIRMPAFPVTDLLPKFRILPAQRGHFGAKFRNFLPQFPDQIQPAVQIRGLARFLKKNAIHDTASLPKSA